MILRGRFKRGVKVMTEVQLDQLFIDVKAVLAGEEVPRAERALGGLAFLFEEYLRAVRTPDVQRSEDQRHATLAAIQIYTDCYGRGACTIENVEKMLWRCLVAVQALRTERPEDTEGVYDVHVLGTVLPILRGRV